MVSRMLRLRISKCDLMERLYTITHLHKPTDPTGTKLGEKVYWKVNTGYLFLRYGTHIV